MSGEATIGSAAAAAVRRVRSDTDDVVCDTDGPVVGLHGSVHAVEDRDRLVAAALGAAGVRVVVDGLDIRSRRPEPRSDRAVADDVAALLGSLPSLPADDLRARVRGGVVILGGTIGHGFQRDTVLNLLAAVPGVADVVDAVRIDAHPVRPDGAARRLGRFVD